ncbi:PREDICTED: uncharacterized protein LOC101308023 [Fragaria vesca subsp. vesca]|uniref:uncharacterized protein LOC101308023 n=1 Tax=Fragaria vesca subsp. vesca TaxID=101020 RepID=UPI0002C30B1E|nr:PREDICTED: uncharacterized protein LOC101308023 [Fragaria vesca subsp. vesca]
MEEADSPTPRPPFVEVKCESSGMRRRFAIGTEAGFAASVINNKLGSVDSVYIEAVKEGEEPITFGPNSLLVDYGHGWTLHTVTGEGVVRPKPIQVHHVMGSDNLHAAKRVPDQAINFIYIGKIVIAFILIFVLGAILALVLENVPRLIELLEQYV